ncbi:MAG TPA: hypothetical protein VII06_41245 [Chloroflexota bacterium]|jgi:hypothetical protein
MLWRSLGMALVLVAGLGALVAPRAHAQEMNQCYDTRWGSMGCPRMEEFNFSDPVEGLNSRYLMRGDVIYITNSAMQTTAVPANSSAQQTRYPQRGDYAGQNAQELYCAVFGKGC